MSKNHYLLQNKGKKTESAAKVEVVVQDLHYNDEGENNVSEENIFQQQMNKIKDAVVLLTERVIQDAGMGMFLEDHVSFASAICIEILQLSDKEKEIFLWREKQARDQNVPPSYIFEDRFLKKITKDLKNKNISKEKIKKYFRDSAVAYDFIVQIKP